MSVLVDCFLGLIHLIQTSLEELRLHLIELISGLLDHFQGHDGIVLTGLRMNEHIGWVVHLLQGLQYNMMLYHLQRVENLLSQTRLLVDDLLDGLRIEFYLERLEGGLQEREISQLRLPQLLILELVEVQLLIVLLEQLTEQVPVGEIALQIGHLLRQLDLVVQPLHQKMSHR